MIQPVPARPLLAPWMFLTRVMVVKKPLKKKLQCNNALDRSDKPQWANYHIPYMQHKVPNPYDSVPVLFVKVSFFTITVAGA